MSMRDAAMSMRDVAMWYDISLPIHIGMNVYPGDPDTQIVSVMDERCQAGACVSHLSMSCHAGTHIDAPSHYFEDGQTVDSIPPEKLIGEVSVVEFATFLQGKASYNRVLLKNAHPMQRWPDDLPIPAVLGVDGMSVGGSLVHRHLLRLGVVLVEGLDLSGVAEGIYTLVCLPIKLEGLEGAPARAMLWGESS